MSSPAYVEAVKLLARRELSEAQVRQRLKRRGYEPDDVDAAVARLKEERSIDDARVAAAMARTQASVKRRGRLRVRRHLESAGIDRAIVRRAVDDAFDGVDEASLIQAALNRRLRGRAIETDAERQRLYRYLLNQGFDAEHVAEALVARRRST